MSVGMTCMSQSPLCDLSAEDGQVPIELMVGQLLEVLVFVEYHSEHPGVRAIETSFLGL